MNLKTSHNSSLKSVPFCVFIANSDGLIRFASESSYSVIGWSSETLVGQRLESFLYLQDGAPILSLCECRGEVMCLMPDGKTMSANIIIESIPIISGLPSAHYAEMPVINEFVISLSALEECAVCHNIGDVRVGDANVGDVESDDVTRQYRLQSLGALAGVVAHDVNNILTGVLGHVSFLRLLLTSEGNYSESLGAIEDGARRAAMMTQQILDFTRGRGGETGRINISQVIRKSVDLLQASLPNNMSIDLNLSEPDLHVRGKESQLSQVVMNLIVNARDALIDGGVIQLELDAVKVLARRTSSLGEIFPGWHVELIITDNGVGIPLGVRERMFEPFFTTKSKGGTGLGLATVISVVRAHNGYIEVESEPGQGTRFHLWFPLDTAVEDANELINHVSPNTVGDVPKGTERILVVDDEEAIRLVVQRSLEHLGYQVDTAQSGLEALDLYEKYLGEYKLVILDMMMPQMPGDEVFHNLQMMDSLVPVLIASGYASDGRTQAVLDSGGLGFIQKPFAVEELAQEVRFCLDKSVALK